MKTAASMEISYSEPSIKKIAREESVGALRRSPRTNARKDYRCRSAPSSLGSTSTLIGDQTSITISMGITIKQGRDRIIYVGSGEIQLPLDLPFPVPTHPEHPKGPNQTGIVNTFGPSRESAEEFLRSMEEKDNKIDYLEAELRGLLENYSAAEAAPNQMSMTKNREPTPVATFLAEEGDKGKTVKIEEDEGEEDPSEEPMLEEHEHLHKKLKGSTSGIAKDD